MTDSIVERLRAEVVPCPGKGWGGNGVQHCAECCFGTGVDATTADELRIMVLARDAADEIERLRAEVSDLHNGINWQTTCLHCAKLLDINYGQYCQIERLRAAGDALAEALRAMTRLAAPPDMDEWVAWQLGVADPALAAFKEARRG